ncbi:uncharacterized protein BDZ83DRAFT_725310 [Colletotrichum acutatum]|uniref:Uncharacterized protein n=1 Tax=Glomerella acutata TaxID=27357 RepID=A0AAD8XQQ2_GLOAC|nr:uncharacterized protein BDZ83DRAFT_725310 [Colletotrichum acutatum]KAK1731703.1 hypothetical protein BDZ83DRAFT_725310 [Colletotrichum acutatum]
MGWGSSSASLFTLSNSPPCVPMLDTRPARLPLPLLTLGPLALSLLQVDEKRLADDIELPHKVNLLQMSKILWVGTNGSSELGLLNDLCSRGRKTLEKYFNTGDSCWSIEDSSPIHGATLSSENHREYGNTVASMHGMACQGMEGRVLRPPYCVHYSVEGDGIRESSLDGTTPQVRTAVNLSWSALALCYDCHLSSVLSSSMMMIMWLRRTLIGLSRLDQQQADGWLLPKRQPANGTGVEVLRTFQVSPIVPALSVKPRSSRGVWIENKEGKAGKGEDDSDERGSLALTMEKDN